MDTFDFYNNTHTVHNYSFVDNTNQRVVFHVATCVSYYVSYYVSCCVKATSASSLSLAAPDSIATRAFSTPSFIDPVTLAA